GRDLRLRGARGLRGGDRGRSARRRRARGGRARRHRRPSPRGSRGGRAGGCRDSMTDAHQKPTEAPPSSNVPGSVLALGEIVNDTYEVRAMLGAGGMGEVYEAHDRVLNRRVALKVVHPTIAGEYLLREGRALAAIHHPGVVAVHTMGVHRGIAYLVLDRIRGLSVDRLL